MLRFPVMALFALCCCSVQADDPDDRTPEQWIAFVKEQLTQNLKDPESAQFRKIYFAPFKNGEKGAYICGEMNAKNGYGGYVGFTPFYMDTTEERAVLVDPRRYSKHTLYLTICQIAAEKAAEAEKAATASNPANGPQGASGGDPPR